MLIQKMLPVMMLALGLAACQSNGNGASTSSSSSSSKTASKGICRMTQADNARAGRDVIYLCNGQAVLNSPEAKSLLNNHVSVNFSSGGSVIKSDLITRQAANRVGNSDEETCVRAFINAAKRFQETTAKMGGSRVSNFHSYLNKKSLSGGQYECEVGTFHGRVVMKGNVAR